MAKIIKTEKSDNGTSYRIDFGDGMILWFDVWADDDSELTGDWNKYIFFTDNVQDIREQAFQAEADNFAEAFELCSEAYETKK